MLSQNPSTPSQLLQSKSQFPSIAHEALLHLHPISSPISLLPNLLTHLLCCSSNTLRHTCSSGTLPFLLPVTSFCYYEQSEEVKKACFFASFLSLPNTIFSVSPLFLSDPSQNSNSSLSTIFSIPLLCFIFILSPSDILYVSFSISLTTI